jgi:hypothetical protein
MPLFLRWYPLLLRLRLNTNEGGRFFWVFVNAVKTNMLQVRMRMSRSRSCDTAEVGRPAKPIAYLFHVPKSYPRDGRGHGETLALLQVCDIAWVNCFFMVW